MAAPAQQQQQEPHTHPLEHMQAMINLVLIQSGRHMKIVKHSPSESAKMQSNLKRVVSAGRERFHASVDELDKEIRLAQAVLRRDLALVRADRRKKEAAAKEKEAEKARRDAGPKEVAAPPAPAPAPANSSSPVPVKAEPAPPVKVEPVAEKVPTPKPPTPPADVPMANTDTLNTAPESEFDFDAMFGDSAMDTSGDAGNEQGELDLDADADLNLGLDDQPDLLRGLEDFAKGDTGDISGQNNASNSMDLDFNMSDLPDMNPTEQPAPVKPVEEAPAQQTTAADELNLDTMTTDNLDDLFNMDYENPEVTQFDDAFFGFGDN